MPIQFSASRLANYLPAVYQENDFIGRFLSAFEKVLLGRAPEQGVDPGFPGLEESIAGLVGMLDPREAPEGFLEWLAGWTSFTFRADLDAGKQREFLANVIQLYRRRGTKANLKKLLEIFTIGIPAITEADVGELQVGVRSTIGVDTSLGGGSPHFFRVTIALPRGPEATQNRQMAIAYSLIEMEKPAHTDYHLIVNYPSMQIGKHSTIGVDTLLGTETQE